MICHHSNKYVVLSYIMGYVDTILVLVWGWMVGSCELGCVGSL